MPNDSKPGNISALILGAGDSKRMGSPKFMLQFDKNHTFLEKIVEDYQKFGCKEIMVVLNRASFDILKKTNYKYIENQKIIINHHVDRGRFYSVQIGLKAIKDSKLVFVHNVDNPFVNHSVLNLLIQNQLKAEYIIPSYQKKGGHPILISHRIIQKIINSTNLNFSLKTFLEQFNNFYVKVDFPEVLCNINSIEDYLDFQKNTGKNKIGY